MRRAIKKQTFFFQLKHNANIHVQRFEEKQLNDYGYIFPNTYDTFLKGALRGSLLQVNPCKHLAYVSLEHYDPNK
jgi:hypothetical protein